MEFVCPLQKEDLASGLYLSYPSRIATHFDTLASPQFFCYVPRTMAVALAEEEGANKKVSVYMMLIGI